MFTLGLTSLSTYHCDNKLGEGQMQCVKIGSHVKFSLCPPAGKWSQALLTQEKTQQLFSAFSVLGYNILSFCVEKQCYNFLWLKRVLNRDVLELNWLVSQA